MSTASYGQACLYKSMSSTLHKVYFALLIAHLNDVLGIKWGTLGRKCFCHAHNHGGQIQTLKKNSILDSIAQYTSYSSSCTCTLNRHSVYDCRYFSEFFVLSCRSAVRPEVHVQYIIADPGSPYTAAFHCVIIFLFTFCLFYWF